MAKLGNRSMRNLSSAGKFTVGTADKAAVGLFKWAVTDHMGIFTRPQAIKFAGIAHRSCGDFELLSGGMAETSPRWMPDRLKPPVPPSPYAGIAQLA